MKRLALIAKLPAILCFLSAYGMADVTISPSQPTHYFYTPTARVNPPFHLVASLHEISFSFPANLQLQASLVDNIGRINFGGKFGILDNLAIGAGLAHTLVHFGKGTHGIPQYAPPRFGAFLCYGFAAGSTFEGSVTAHSQVGDRASAGADLGFMLTPSDFWSLILEAGSSIDFRDEFLYLNFDGGVRIHPPAIPFLSFDIGIDIEEFPVTHRRPSVAPYFDVIFAMNTR